MLTLTDMVDTYISIPAANTEHIVICEDLRIQGRKKCLPASTREACLQQQVKRRMQKQTGSFVASNYWVAQGELN